MSTFLNLLPLELKQISGDIEPSEAVQDGDYVMGTVPESLRKLYTLSILKQKAKDEAMLEAKYASGELRQTLSAQANELHGKAHVLGELFRIAVTDEFSLWDKPAVAVRTGWQVVWFERKRGGNDFLRTLFGELEF